MDEYTSTNFMAFLRQVYVRRTNWIFDGLTPNLYQTILIDPPWSFKGYAEDGLIPHRQKVQPYRAMSIEAIKQLPVPELMARDCAVYLWAVDATLDRTFEVAKYWGLTYKTIVFIWLKVGKTNPAARPISLGYWSRKQCEPCLLFTKGKPARLTKGVRQLIEAPRREHSRKPDEQYGRIEALTGPPYCELFATQRRREWDSWGDGLR